MDRVTFMWLILLGEDLTKTHEEVTCVLLEEALHSNVKLLMSLDCISIVKDRGYQLPMLDVHVFEPVPLLLPVELVEQCLL